MTTVSASSFSISFEYTDRKDLYGDKLLSKISLRDAGMSSVRQAVFKFAEVVSTAVMESQLTRALSASENLQSLKTRYFLTSLEIGSVGKPTDQLYGFEYFNPAFLPHRFSFSQDVLGYYNGKANTGFVPKREGRMFLQSTAAGKLTAYEGDMNLADREPAEVSTVGMLNKITYPTGGTDVVAYEANTYSETIEVQEPASQEENFTNRNPNQRQIASTILRVPFKQSITLRLFTDYAGGKYPYDNDGSLHWVEFQLWDVTNNKPMQIPNTTFPKSNAGALVMKLFEQYVDSIELMPGIDYQVRATLYGELTSISYLIDYFSSSTPRQVESVYYGQRVKQVTTNSLISPPITKSYNYKSFSQGGAELVFEDKTALEIDAHNLPGLAMLNGFASYYYEMHVDLCDPTAACSNSPKFIRVHTLGSKDRYDKNVYGGQPVAYSQMTEFHNLAKTSFIASEYFASSNEAYIRVLGDYMPGVPLSNLGWRNGMESKRYYGSLSDGVYSIAKKQEWSYSEEPSATPSTLALYNTVIHRVFRPGYIYSNNGAFFYRNFLPYAAYCYPVYSRWYHLDSFKETAYPDKSPGTTSAFSTEVSYSYNPKDKLLTEEQTRSSTGEKLTKQSHRPTYMVDAGLDPGGVYRAMVNKHLLSPLVETIQLRGAMQLSRERSSYHTPHPGIYVPSFVEVQNGAQPSEIRARYHAYDETGNVVSFSLEKGTVTCLVWGYGGQQLIAKVVNADYSKVVTALGGEASLKAFRDRLLPSSEETSTFLAPLRSATVLNAAQVTTYAYKPLVGMTSQVDPSGRTTFYEYDALGRLVRVRDEKDRILSQQQYHYAGQ